MKLSEYRGEQALDILANILEPAVEIMSDKEVSDALRGKSGKPSKARAIAVAIKKHKSAVISILAATECADPEEYVKTLNVITLPKKALELLNDKDLLDLFRAQSQTEDGTSSGSATVSIEDQQA